MKTTLLARMERLRQRALGAAEAELARRLATETEAAQAERAAIATLQHEAELASDLGGDDAAVEAYAAWLPRGLADLSRARDARAEAAAATAIARAQYIAASRAFDAIRDMQARHAAARQASLARAEQSAMDEIGSAQRR